ncbi:unnamed protein product [Cladocopium goreaui]|uniref:cystathionine beta-synthase n=1 Tax=Cladocopium goreaui TaxID=2562237 RepID=A0A9P1CV60_9DINO|nr:unnamed protein product [Cladocopium goreaui]
MHRKGRCLSDESLPCPLGRSPPLSPSGGVAATGEDFVLHDALHVGPLDIASSIGGADPAVVYVRLSNFAARRRGCLRLHQEAEKEDLDLEPFSPVLHPCNGNGSGFEARRKRRRSRSGSDFSQTSSTYGSSPNLQVSTGPVREVSAESTGLEELRPKDLEDSERFPPNLALERCSTWSASGRPAAGEPEEEEEIASIQRHLETMNAAAADLNAAQESLNACLKRQRSLIQLWAVVNAPWQPAPGAESVRDDKVSRAKRIQCNLLAKRTMARTEEVRDLCHEILRLYGNPEAGSNEELSRFGGVALRKVARAGFQLPQSRFIAAVDPVIARAREMQQLPYDEAKEGVIRAPDYVGWDQEIDTDFKKLTVGPIKGGRPYQKICDSALDLIGFTPRHGSTRSSAGHGRHSFFVVDPMAGELSQVELFNAGGSVKDRIAKRMVEEAEKTLGSAMGRQNCTGEFPQTMADRGSDILIEATSGNTGVGLCMVSAIKGYKQIICLPKKMSGEKVNTMKCLGAEILRTPTEAAWDAEDSHIFLSARLAKDLGGHVLDQYKNPGNPLAHYDGTAEEIAEQCEGKLDYMIMSTGTGGTMTGVAKKLKELIPGVKVVGVDPYGSILVAQPEQMNEKSNRTGQEKILAAKTALRSCWSQLVGFFLNVGYDFIPTVLDREIVDYWVPVKTDDDEAFAMCRALVRHEGLLIGGSCGSTVAGAYRFIKENKIPKGKRCAVLLADSARNYMSKFMDDGWMQENGFDMAKMTAAVNEKVGLFSRRFLKLTLVNQFFAMESTLRLNISCLAPSGKEVRKLRIALPSTHTVQQLLRKVEAHPEAEGRSFKDLRLKGSGAYLHMEDQLKDVLRVEERDLEAVPLQSRSPDEHWLVDTVRHAYVPNEKFREDKHCNFLSCRVGARMEIHGRANGWFYCVDDLGEKGFVPDWVFEDSDPLSETDESTTSPASPTGQASTQVKAEKDMYGEGGRLQGLGVVDRIHVRTSGYVDSIILYMKDGQVYRYGKGGYRDAEVLLGRDETILSITQKEKQSLGEIVFTTSKRELVSGGWCGTGKQYKQNFFECRPGHQIHHFDIEDSVLCGIHWVEIPSNKRKNGLEDKDGNELQLQPKMRAKKSSRVYEQANSLNPDRRCHFLDTFQDFLEEKYRDLLLAEATIPGPDKSFTCGMTDSSCNARIRHLATMADLALRFLKPHVPWCHGLFSLVIMIQVNYG